MEPNAEGLVRTRSGLRAEQLLRSGRAVTLVVEAGGGGSLGTVEELARLRLVAQRTGATLRVQLRDAATRDLVCLAGLADVFAGGESRQRQRQAEPFEHLSAELLEEVVAEGATSGLACGDGGHRASSVRRESANAAPSTASTANRVRSSESGQRCE
jgi:hypothetical protein